MKKEHKCKCNVVKIIGGIALTVIGIIVIPQIIDECTKKAYKSGIKTESIDFDNLGPEIVKKEEK